jgi:hypothetical protein
MSRKLDMLWICLADISQCDLFDRSSAFINAFDHHEDSSLLFHVHATDFYPPAGGDEKSVV